MKAVRLQSMQHYGELLLILHDIKSADSGGKRILEVRQFSAIHRLWVRHSSSPAPLKFHITHKL